MYIIALGKIKAEYGAVQYAIMKCKGMVKKMVKNVLRDNAKEKEKILEWFLKEVDDHIILKCRDCNTMVYSVVGITPKGQLYLYEGISNNIGLEVDSKFAIEIEN